MHAKPPTTPKRSEADATAAATNADAATYYMEYHGDLVFLSFLNHWYQVGEKFHARGRKFVQLGTNHNPEVIKYRS